MDPQLCDPLGRHDLSVGLFDEVPAGHRPVFVFRRLNEREYSQLANALDGLGSDSKSTDERVADVFTALAIGLVGWRRQIDPATGDEVPFEAGAVSEALPQIINRVEAVELLSRRLRGVRVTTADKKKSESEP